MAERLIEPQTELRLEEARADLSVEKAYAWLEAQPPEFIKLLWKLLVPQGELGLSKVDPEVQGVVCFLYLAERESPGEAMRLLSHVSQKYFGVIVEVPVLLTPFQIQEKAFRVRHYMIDVSDPAISDLRGILSQYVFACDQCRISNEFAERLRNAAASSESLFRFFRENDDSDFLDYYFMRQLDELYGVLQRKQSRDKPTGRPVMVIDRKPEHMIHPCEPSRLLALMNFESCLNDHIDPKEAEQEAVRSTMQYIAAARNTNAVNRPRNRKQMMFPYTDSDVIVQRYGIFHGLTKKSPPGEIRHKLQGQPIDTLLVACRILEEDILNVSGPQQKYIKKFLTVTEDLIAEKMIVERDASEQRKALEKKQRIRKGETVPEIPKIPFHEIALQFTGRYRQLSERIMRHGIVDQRIRSRFSHLIVEHVEEDKTKGIIANTKRLVKAALLWFAHSRIFAKGAGKAKAAARAAEGAAGAARKAAKHAASRGH